MDTILAAYVLDLMWGDPHWLPHPVRGIGWLIAKGESWIRWHISRLCWGGVGLTAVITISIYAVSSVGLRLLAEINPWLELTVSTLLVYTCFSLRSLARAANRIYYELQHADLQAARKRLICLVSRDTHNLDESGVIKATVESVAENTVDGFIAPLFYALIGGAPLALAYKAVNTLDSMIGYKNQRYQELGWAAARLDDIANYIPARLMYGLLPLASGIKRAGFVWRIMKRDGRKHPSPNSGISEAGFAACLEIQLGGTSYYQGQASHKPLLGEDKIKLNPGHIKQAVNLMYCLSVWVVGSALLLVVIT
jgi:adenosylcobinamide-phosphate synthase